MKIALVLLVCLVGIGSTQRKFYFYPYVPYLNYNQMEEGNSAEEQEIAFRSFGRPQPQNRFLWNLNPFLMTVTSTLTSTSFTTLTSSLTTVVVSSCIPVDEFIVLGAAAAATTLTTACARRRRDYGIEKAVQESFEASDSRPILSTSLPFDDLEMRSKREYLPASLTSSMDEPVVNNRQKRQFNLFTSITSFSTTTITSTVTTFAFTSTVVKKTVIVATAKGLSCLPGGFIVC
jgi:hypothetical protein